MKYISCALMLAFVMMACQKKAEKTTKNEEDLLTGTNWVTEVAGAKQQINFSADKSFKFTSLINIQGTSQSITATISGNWRYEGQQIFVTNPKLDLLNNGKAVTNIQSVINGLPAAYYNVVSAAIQQYNQFISIDANGNITLSQAAADKFVWAINNINEGSLEITIGAQKITFTRG